MRRFFNIRDYSTSVMRLGLNNQQMFKFSYNVRSTLPAPTKTLKSFGLFVDVLVRDYIVTYQVPCTCGDIQCMDLFGVSFYPFFSFFNYTFNDLEQRSELRCTDGSLVDKIVKTILPDVAGLVDFLGTDISN
jgi:hypothetical protein